MLRGQTSVYLLVYFLEFTISSQSCRQLSLKTMRNVASCPNEDEKIRVDKNRICAGYWKNFKHNCTEDPLKFQYHCVINFYRNETIEVCGGKKIIHGYCTEFNIYLDEGTIQDSFANDCSKFNPPCDKRYYSTDAYLYKPCYNFSEVLEIEQLSKTTTSTGSSNNSTENLLIGNITKSTATDKVTEIQITEKIIINPWKEQQFEENQPTEKQTAQNQIEIPATKSSTEKPTTKKPMGNPTKKNPHKNPTTKTFSESKEIHLEVQFNISQWWIGIVGCLFLMATTLAAIGLYFFFLYMNLEASSDGALSTFK